MNPDEKPEIDFTLWPELKDAYWNALATMRPIPRRDPAFDDVPFVFEPYTDYVAPKFTGIESRT